MPRHIEFHVPLNLLTTPRSGECVADSWWMVHPEHGALFVADVWETAMSRAPIPRTNYDERIVRRFLQAGYEAQQIKVAFMSQAYAPMKAAYDVFKASKSA
jgi:hypothetical protein